jgi:hypothetical protein
MLKGIGSFGSLASIIIFMDAFLTIISGFSLPQITTFSQFGQLEIQQKDGNTITTNKVAILTFGNAPKSQYTYAKPILD